MTKNVTALLFVAGTLAYATGGRSDETKPRVFITDSASWEISGGWGESGDAGGGEVLGGARPQTAEIIKTFGQRCPEIVVNDRKEIADYVVILEHEGGKGIARRRNKIAVFSRSGDSIFSDSTRSLGNSVKDACSAIVDNFKSSPPRPVTAAPESAQATPTIARAKAVPARAAPVAAAGTLSWASVAVKSEPDGADITVDGKYVGSTPSTLKLAPGDHTIKVEKSGFKAWERTISLTSGSDVKVSATLEKP